MADGQSVVETKKNNTAAKQEIGGQEEVAPVVGELAIGSTVRRAQAAPQRLTSSDVTVLQRTVGNQAVARLLGRSASPSSTPSPVPIRYHTSAAQHQPQVQRRVVEFNGKSIKTEETELADLQKLIVEAIGKEDRVTARQFSDAIQKGEYSDAADKAGRKKALIDSALSDLRLGNFMPKPRDHNVKVMQKFTVSAKQGFLKKGEDAEKLNPDTIPAFPGVYNMTNKIWQAAPSATTGTTEEMAQKIKVPKKHVLNPKTGATVTVNRNLPRNGGHWILDSTFKGVYGSATDSAWQDKYENVPFTLFFRAEKLQRKKFWSFFKGPKPLGERGYIEIQFRSGFIGGAHDQNLLENSARVSAAIHKDTGSPVKVTFDLSETTLGTEREKAYGKDKPKEAPKEKPKDEAPTPGLSLLP